jgi:RNA polymerase sigma-70 factor (ECF subfamily)
LGGGVKEGLLVTANDKTGPVPVGAQEEISQWIQEAKRGDASAFRQLVVCHQRQVLKTTFHLLGRLDLAQDAAQEVFLRLFKSLRGIEENRSLSPWLYRVAVNVCRDFHRRNFSARLLSLESLREDDGWDPPSSAEGQQTDLLREEKKRWVGEAIRQLPHKEREALVFRDIEGLSTREVARILKSSEATVRVQISSARLKIRRYLELKMGGKT